MILEVLKYTLVIVSVLLIVVIVIQPKGEGLSLSSSSMTSERFGTFEKRGPEKVLHYATIVLGIVFLVLSILYYFMG